MFGRHCPVLQRLYSEQFQCYHHVLQVLKLDTQMQKLAEELKHESSLLVFGRGYNYATALEAALKVGIGSVPHPSPHNCSMRALFVSSAP